MNPSMQLFLLLALIWVSINGANISNQYFHGNIFRFLQTMSHSNHPFGVNSLTSTGSLCSICLSI